MKALHGRFAGQRHHPITDYPAFGAEALWAWHAVVTPAMAGVWFPFPAGVDAHQRPWPLVFGGRPLAPFRDTYEVLYTLAGHVPGEDDP